MTQEREPAWKRFANYEPPPGYDSNLQKNYARWHSKRLTIVQQTVTLHGAGMPAHACPRKAKYKANFDKRNGR